MNESKISAIVGALIIIVIGVMVVNYFRNLRSGATTPNATTTEASPAPAGKEYTVAKGDTLWSIAVKNYNDGFKWTEIKDANKLSDSDSLKEGQKLIIPVVAAAASPVAQASASPTVKPTVIASASATPSGTPVVTATPAATVAPTSAPAAPSEEKISADKYTVVKGDSLWTIAERAYGDGYKWVEIAKENKLVNPNVIHTGNVFTLPR
jgi:nucleoid-associated protein YgaU